MKMDMTLVRAEISNEYVGVHFLVQHVQNANQVAKLVQEIVELAGKFTTKRVVINFSGLQHLTSAFLAKLVSLNKTLGEMGVELRLCGMNKEIESAFRLCKLHKLIKVFATEEEAAGK